MSDLSSTQAQQICQAIRQAGQQAQQLAQRPFNISQKGPQDFVTSVDQALDQQLSAQFQTWFPQDGIITEENVQSTQAFHGTYPQLWLIDPLDGTQAFMQGKRDYAVMVGLLRDHQPLAGWVYCPPRDLMYWGGAQWGVFRSVGGAAPQELTRAATAALSTDRYPVVIGYRDWHSYGAAIQAHVPGVYFYSLGSFGLKVMEVVQRRAGLYIYLNGRVKLWDTSGPLAIARAAGLVCCDLDGQPLSFRPEQVDPHTLAHKQPILVGWPQYVALLREPIRAAIAALTIAEDSLP